MLSPELSRQRQRRLLHVLQERKLDAAVVGSPHHVYYLSAFLTGWQHQSAFVLYADGRTCLVSPNAPAEGAAADQAVAYEANWFSTLRQEQPAEVARRAVEALAERLKGRGLKSVGIDASAVTSQLALQLADAGVHCSAVDEPLQQMRRVKDADELDLMGRAIRCTEAMYRRAKEVVVPGVPELRVFAELHAAAVESAGEPLSALLGNDFACGVGGGPARGGRVAGDGQIYVLDLGPVYRGYFSDNCRALAVNRKPTDAQMKAWETVVSCFPLIERLAKPGARCREIFAAVDEHFRAGAGSPQTHHLGHGVGLQPHEFPHLNPRWDDVLLEGEFFTAEPGLYGPHLAGGIRVENNYLVTADGVRNLLDFPMDLV